MPPVPKIKQIPYQGQKLPSGNLLSIEKIVTIFLLTSLIFAWMFGAKQADAEIQASMRVLFPDATIFTKVGEQTYAAWSEMDDTKPVGFLSTADAIGYGGPLKIVVAVDLSGNISGTSIIEHRETPTYMQRFFRSDYLERLIGKTYADHFQIGDDIDAISGATYTSRALVAAAQQGARRAVSEGLHLVLPPMPASRVIVGIPEITLIVLYILSFIGHQQKFRYKKQMRWLTMITGMIILGFWYSRPLTLSVINKFLLGYWPSWQTDLYWYLLLGGILFVFTLDNKNPYCEWFCPFGAVQECMGAISGVKASPPGSFRPILIWIQRGLAWLAILLALLFRNPALTSYEIFGTLFKLNGSTIQFILLGIILVASLFIRRPWCAYLCPLRPVTDLYRAFRKSIFEIWKRIKTKTVL